MGSTTSKVDKQEMYSATGKAQNRKKDHWPSEPPYWKFSLHAGMGNLKHILTTSLAMLEGSKIVDFAGVFVCVW